MILVAGLHAGLQSNHLLLSLTQLGAQPRLHSGHLGFLRRQLLSTGSSKSTLISQLIMKGSELRTVLKGQHCCLQMHRQLPLCYLSSTATFRTEDFTHYCGIIFVFPHSLVRPPFA